MTGSNDEGEVRFNPIDYDFGHQLVSGVAKSNRPEVPNEAFRNKADEGSVGILRHGMYGKGLSTQVQGFFSHNVPILLVEKGVKPIRAWGFQ